MRHRFAGINVDFEQVSPGDRDQMTAFIGELAGTLKRAGLLVTQSVPPDDDAFDLRRLAELNDYLVAMVYDEHADADEPGPIASQAWVDRQLAALAATVPCDKTIIGLGNYGYEWTRGSGTAKTVGFAELMSTARRYDSAIEWDPVSKNAAFHYQRAGVWHDVWFLDAVTALNQARAAARAGFRWLALWRLGAEDPSVWSVISRERWPDGHADAQRLTSLPAQDIITSAADGEVLRITDMPRAGRRHVWRTDDDDAGERYESPPSSFIVERTGGSRRTVIALTLDDGPDPDYTPRVLDVLRRYRVPATFFVTGVNAEASPDLLRRIYREGHDIGNHHVLASEHRARLARARATGAECDAANHPACARRLDHALPAAFQRRQRAADARRARVDSPVAGARLRDGERAHRSAGLAARRERRGDRDRDRPQVHRRTRRPPPRRGGDRSATVAALPRIIELFRSQGYRFVTVSELIGRPRHAVMPPVGDVQR